MTTSLSREPGWPSKTLNVSLWAVQLLVGLAHLLPGFVKLTTPIQELAQIMPWAGEFSPEFVRFIGLVDIAGGLGVLLPALIRVKPGLTVLAAAGCSVLQILALIFHLSRGEAQVAPLNLTVLALALLIVWGRGRKLPIAPRG